MQPFFHAVFATGAADITWWAMSARGAIIFVFAVVLFRLFFVRVFGRFAAFDTTVAILLGSTLSRAMTGTARFVPSLIAVTVLMALHAVLVWATFRFHGLGRLVKGREIRLVSDGRMLPDAMRRAGISEGDLREALRLGTGQAELADIAAAYMERDGQISFIRAR